MYFYSTDDSEMRMSSKTNSTVQVNYFNVNSSYRIVDATTEMETIGIVIPANQQPITSDCRNPISCLQVPIGEIDPMLVLESLPNRYSAL